MPIQNFICKRCGKEFQKAYYPCREIPVYCSPECRKDRVVSKCRTCGKAFFTQKSRKGVKYYCSKECGTIGRKRKYRPCVFCGKLFNKSGGKEHCSLKCACEHKKTTRLKKTCQECGKEFIVKKGATGRMFCSMKCSGINVGRRQRKENNPNWTGGNKQDRGYNWASQSAKARKRDNYTCQHCGKHRKGSIRDNIRALPVHHIVPYKTFNGDWEKANELSNIITLCEACHRRVEVKLQRRNSKGAFTVNSEASPATMV